jgi:hypothetical protein
MATSKRPRFKVLPHRGKHGAIVPDRWCVCLSVSKEVFLGPYHTRTAADIVCAALNAAEADREKTGR